MKRRALVVLVTLFLAACASFSQSGGEYPTALGTIQQTPEEEQEFQVVNGLYVQPGWVQHGIWHQTARCLGVYDPPPVDAITWAIADSLKASDGSLAYGVTVAGEPPLVIMERDWWYHPTILSHEIIHVFGYGEYSPEMAHCTLYVPGEIPYRRWKD